MWSTEYPGSLKISCFWTQHTSRISSPTSWELLLMQLRWQRLRYPVQKGKLEAWIDEQVTKTVENRECHWSRRHSLFCIVFSDLFIHPMYEAFEIWAAILNIVTLNLADCAFYCFSQQLFSKTILIIDFHNRLQLIKWLHAWIKWFMLTDHFFPRGAFAIKILYSGAAG